MLVFAHGRLYNEMNRIAPAPDTDTLLISHRHQFIFLKTHKTAGTSVEIALEPLCAPPDAETGRHYRDELISEFGVIGARGGALKTAEWRNHMSAAAIRAKVGRTLWDRYARYTIVRNPYDRMVSMFWSRMKKPEREAAVNAPIKDLRAQFGEWMRTQPVSNNLNKLVIGPFLSFSHVLYFESLDADFAAMLSDLNAPLVSLQRFKADRRKRTENWRDYYDQATQRHVQRTSAFELAYFGYDFSGGPRPQSFLGRGARVVRASPLLSLTAFQQPARLLKKST